MKVIIIGGVATGAAAATRLSREMKDAKITVFEKSSKTSYSNCGLPYGISGEASVEKLAPHDNSHLESKGIQVFTNTEVIKINTESHSVEAKNLSNDKIETYSYDKLILAMGAQAIVFNIPGLKEEKNVYSLRTHDDLQNIISGVVHKKRAIIIGAGFIGLEIAENLVKKGLDVTIVEMRQRIAGFDYDFSSFLEEKLRSNGINLKLNQTIELVDPINKKIKLSAGESLEYDIIFTTGIKPNTDLLNGTGIKKDQKGIVETNQFMQTSIKNIYAGGDIVYTTSVVNGMKTYAPFAYHAKTQGRIIADHIAGLKTDGQYLSTGASGFNIFGTMFAQAGLSEAYLKHTDIKFKVVMATTKTSAAYVPGSEKVTMKMLYEAHTGKLLGIQSMGKTSDKIIDVFAIALKSKMTIYDLESMNFLYQPHISTTINPLNLIASLAIKSDRLGIENMCPMALPEDVPIFDIRSSTQHDVSHIRNAKNIPTSKLSIETVGRHLLNKPIAVHCNSGFGASLAARKLLELGYKHVINLYGGNNLYQLMLKK